MTATALPQLVLRSADAHADRVFLRTVSGDSYTTADAACLGAAWGATLRELGVQGGQPVVTMLPNGPLGFLGWLGSAWIGAVEASLNSSYPTVVLDRMVRQIGARHAIVSDANAPLWEPLLANGALDVIAVATSPDAFVVKRSGGESGVALGAVGALAPVNADRYNISGITFTSGTTGMSKAVVLPWGHWEDRAESENIPARFRGKDSVFYSTFDMFHATGRLPLYAAFPWANTVVTRERFSTHAWLDDIKRHECTIAMLMGAMTSFVFNSPHQDDDDSSALELVVLAPVPPWVDQFKKRFGVSVATSFSATEIGYPVLSGESVEITSLLAGTCGVANPDFDVRLVTEDGRDADPGEPGELWLRSKPWTNAFGYWGLPEETAKAWAGGWFHTGDVLKQDDQGHFFFVERTKDMIRRRGENISSMEVEFAAISHGDVEHVAAYGVPSEYGEDEVMVVAVLRAESTLTPEALHAHLAERLPRFAVPAYIDIVPRLPINHTGKLMKRILRERGVTASTWAAPDTRHAR